jgi:hypothetical protein
VAVGEGEGEDEGEAEGGEDSDGNDDDDDDDDAEDAPKKPMASLFSRGKAPTKAATKAKAKKAAASSAAAAAPAKAGAYHPVTSASWKAGERCDLLRTLVLHWPVSDRRLCIVCPLRCRVPYAALAGVFEEVEGISGRYVLRDSRHVVRVNVGT